MLHQIAEMADLHDAIEALAVRPSDVICDQESGEPLGVLLAQNLTLHIEQDFYMDVRTGEVKHCSFLPFPVTIINN